MGICLPDEVRFLNHPTVEPRPLFPALQDALPLYVQSPRAFVRKDGEVFVIEVEKEKVAEARLVEVSQVALYGKGYAAVGRSYPRPSRGWLDGGGSVSILSAPDARSAAGGICACRRNS